MTVLRYVLVGMIVVAGATSIWVGIQRLRWEAADQTVGLVIPLQEIDRSVGDDELQDYLMSLRTEGVVALSLELADLPQWKLYRISFDDRLVEILRLAKQLDFSFALVTSEDAQAHQSVHALFERAGVQARFLLALSERIDEAMSLWREMLTDQRCIGIVEFSEPLGLAELYQQGWRNFVRAHAITSLELDRLGLEGALTRWGRAVQERSIRLLWITEHQRFYQYVKQLGERLTTLGVKLGEPLPPAPFENSYMIYLLIGTGTVCSVMLLALRCSLKPTGVVAAGLAGLGVIVGGFVWNMELTRQALALVLAIGAPWALICFYTERLSGWKLLAVLSGGSTLVGLVMAALLSDLSYFLKLHEFRGVKVALIAPSLLVLGTELWRMRAVGWDTLRAQLRRGAWLILVMGLGALFFMLERSGNLPSIPAARWEEVARERLEDWLTARPRFKEFLVGHPAVVLWERDHSLLNLSLLALGALGQASIINTLAHLHTPLSLSLWRTVNGLVLGLLIGVFAKYALVRVYQWRRNRSSS